MLVCFDVNGGARITRGHYSVSVSGTMSYHKSSFYESRRREECPHVSFGLASARSENHFFPNFSLQNSISRHGERITRNRMDGLHRVSIVSSIRCLQSDRK